MFQFRRFPTHAYLIQRALTGSSPAGLPHSEIPGSMDICSSPRLIAACHVLLRLLMPRHSPCALIILTSLVRNCFRTYGPLYKWFSRIMQASECSLTNCFYPSLDVFPQYSTLLLALPFWNYHIVQFSRCAALISLKPDINTQTCSLAARCPLFEY